jgi:Flp pilus assembly protein TadG
MNALIRTANLRRRKQTGTAVVLFTLMVALVLIPLLGLAIDGAVVFWVRAKLSAAVDAAALAGGRSINVYEAQSQNTGTAATVAQEWFTANYPSGWLGTSIVGGAPSVTVQPTQTATQQVNVSASAVVPLYFMRLLGQSSITVAASAQSSRRNLNLLLVLDRSGSMGPAPIGSNACPNMIAAAQNFVSMFTDGFDTLGLVTFSTTANSNPIDYAPTIHFKSSSPSLSTTIGNIYCTGATSTAQALAVAYQSIKNTGLASALNVIVLFTDGQPNEVVETSWPIKTQGDTRLDPYSWNATYAGPSTCNSGVTLNGGFTILLAQGTSPSNTGYTGGIYNTTNTVAINSAPGLIGGTGCQFTIQPYNPELYARDDVAYVPNTDAYGNATNTGYKGAPDTFTSGPYSGQIRNDEQIPGIMAAAFNAADNQAATIRNDSNYNTVIYTIGLDGAPDMSIDSTFLERVANDPRSPIYDSSKPAGYYAYAANASALNQAFYQVASQVLRLSH